MEAKNPAKKIMIIEDDKLALTHITDNLYMHGHQVIPCRHPQEASILLNDVIPDLIILDIIMPEMDGYEFCNRIKSQPRLKLVPIIFLTVLGSIEDKITGLKTGADDYITKPFSMDELIARIDVILKKTEMFYELSMRDDLTNAFNRRYFHERIVEELYRVKRTGRPFSIVVMDIDHFKIINDRYGHNTGDRILIEFTKILQCHLRKNDLTARLGGDEFVLLLPETDTENAYKLVERLRRKIQDVTFICSDNSDQRRIRITMSAGIATCPQNGIKSDDLIKVADMALYTAKNSGKNNVRVAEWGNA